MKQDVATPKYRRVLRVLLWPIKHDVELAIIIWVLGIATLIELAIFGVPNSYWGRLVVANLVITIVGYLFGYHQKGQQVEEEYSAALEKFEQKFNKAEEGITNEMVADKKTVIAQPKNVRKTSKQLSKAMARILHFEDDTLIAEMYLKKFESLGFNYVNYDSPGQNPVAVVLNEKPNLIIMDIIMPHMDGFKATELLKADGRTAIIPIMGLCNMGQKEDVERALSLGMVEYLISTKHLPQDTIDHVKKILKLS